MTEDAGQQTRQAAPGAAGKCSGPKRAGSAGRWDLPVARAGWAADDGVRGWRVVGGESGG